MGKHNWGTDCAKGWTMWSLVLCRWKNFFFSRISRLALGPTRSPGPWVARLFPQEYSSQGMKVTTHLPMLLRLWMSGAVPLLPLYAFMVWTWTTAHLHVPFYICTFTCAFLHLYIYMCLFTSVHLHVPFYICTFTCAFLHCVGFSNFLALGTQHWYIRLSVLENRR